MLEVADTGIGIAKADQHALFSRFFRTDAATKAAIQGTGLGLSIVRTIVQSHDGQVEVESEEGAGATFRVTLPTATGAQPLAEPAMLPAA